MHLVDWLCVCLPLLAVFSIGLYTRRHLASVADFMSGSRLGGRYLLAVARGEMWAGAVMFVAAFEVIGKSGFTVAGWWTWIQVPALLIVAVSGFVVYRYRETRALTLAQFFELRYSRNYRRFAGALGFVAGIVNFGFTPAIGARALVYFLGLPPVVELGGLTLPTYVPLMGVFLGITLSLAITGGLITVMITDCVEGIMSQLFYIAIAAALIVMFSWSQISEVLAARPPGQSWLNPVDTAQMTDFNVWYMLMNIFVGVYGTMAWQNASAYNSAALTPHEGRMGYILGRWRESGRLGIVLMLGICALTFLAHPDFAPAAARAHQAIGEIERPQIQEQMRVPIALSELLPIGIKGLLCAVLLMGIFGGDSTHLHSWGGIFVQDVVMPFRRRPPSPAQHIRLLRWGVTGVAVWAFLFGTFFPQMDYILMWWQITMGIFIGGAGSAIIGGLYWRKGTTAGAWVATVAGSVLSGGGIVTRQLLGPVFPLTGMQVSFFSCLIAIGLYVVVSLLTCKEDFNLERMLHRGPYADPHEPTRAAPSASRPSFWARLVGIDAEFSRRDRWVAGALVTWTLFWFGVVVVGTLWNVLAPWPLARWSAFWHVAGFWVPAATVLVTGIWFTVGGVHDIRAFFRRLRGRAIDPLDNGIVAAPAAPGPAAPPR
jgi:SSS family solute:Na+ symporter